MIKLLCNECYAKGRVIDAHYKVPYMTGYTLCQGCYHMLNMPKLKERFEKV